MPGDHGGVDGAAGPVLVTGASGFIGSHLVDRLARDGRPVVGVDLRPAGDRFQQGVQHDVQQGVQHDVRHDVRQGVRHVVGDLRSMEIAALLDGISTVVHLAGLPGVRPSWARFEEYVESNVLVTRRLLEACTARGVTRLVVASSSSVYGDRESGAMAEDQPPAPVSPYAVTKLAAEHLALAYAARPDNDLTVVALRFFTVYGPGQRPDMLISRIIGAVRDGAPIRVYGDGSQRRDYIYVDDVVRAVVAATRAPAGSGVCNVGTGREISVNDVIALAGELIGREPVVRYEAPRPGDVGFTRADVSRTAAVLGFRAEVPFREGLLRHIKA
ncbi:NAD-dependent epimerase/dehydratase family protein [Actinoplanes sp. NPDC051851]|uniref:NAD-dependent epimerase/dehydratase family protein n=1 Tax=Actinoplanes sp. NPDC051851 TaxID=3154753 RepID=UPI00341F9AEB